jgi:membrane-bound lytic murein transglycosylase D
MIKKHLIACSVLLIVMISGKMIINNKPSNPANRLELIPEKGDIPRKEPKKENSTFTLSFADEKIPLKNKKVAKRMNKTLKAHKFDHLQTKVLHKKAAKWFPIIEPILKAHNIPEDFKYIPLVESGLKSGVSPKGAAGYWQFMPGTARHYGLKVNGKVDERLNVRKSTVAAARYLTELRKEFGSWTLVAAAYNLGENKLRRQMNRHKHQNYYELNLNRETASYVYKLVSMKEIIEKPAKYGYLPPAKRKFLADAEVERAHKYIHPKIQHSAILSLQLNSNLF